MSQKGNKLSNVCKNWRKRVKKHVKEWTLKRGLPAPMIRPPPTHTADLFHKMFSSEMPLLSVRKKSYLHFKTQVLITFLFILTAYALQFSL